MFTGSGYMGFSNRWLVSLTRGADIQEIAQQSVAESQL
jgi:hypothetical protein